MKEFNPESICIMHGNAGAALARKVARQLGVRLVPAVGPTHNDGEARVRIGESVRGMRVYIINSTHQPDRSAIELTLLAKAARMASASFISLVVPYMGWLRQDKPDGREPSAAAMHIKELATTTRIDHLMCFDAHSEVALYTGCSDWDLALDHLYTAQFAVPIIRDRARFDMLASPDATGLKRVLKWHHLLEEVGASLSSPAVCVKHRRSAGSVEWVEVIGKVTGRSVLMVDDMIDTGGTHCMGAEALLAAGATDVSLYAAHAVLSGDVFNKLESSRITRVYTTNSIHHPSQRLARAGKGRIEVLDMSPLITAAIREIETGGSISTLFLDGH